MEKIKISYSQLSTYNQCKHRWFLDRTMRVYKPSVETTLGSAIHNTIQEYLEKNRFCKTDKKNINLVSSFEKHLKDEYKKEYKNNNKVHFSTEGDLDINYKYGKTILQYLETNMDKYFPTEDYELLGVEIPVAYDISKNAVFNGFVDLVLINHKTNTARIIDFKTSKKGWTPKDKKDMIKISQLYYYMKILKTLDSLKDVNFEVEYLILKKQPVDGNVVESFIPKYKKEYDGEIESRISELLSNYDENGKLIVKTYEKTPSALCPWCPYFNNPCSGM